MLKLILLVCNIITPPSQCNETTAYSVIPEGVVATNQQCFATGQQSIAKTPLVDERVYTKVMCQRAG